jgi:hypothetical protein
VVLHRCDRPELARGLDLLDVDGGNPDRLDPPPLAVLGDRSQALLERRLGVDPM